MNYESRIKKIKNRLFLLIHYSLFIIHKSQKGFTLIELMVVLSITAVLGTLGIAGFTTYNQVQTLQSSANDVVTMLNLAKSRAQSQVKLSRICYSPKILNGYKVKIFSPNIYRLYLVCSGDDRRVSEEMKVLPSDLRFDADEFFFFPIQTGGVQVGADGKIVISNPDGKTKTIIVNSLGGVSVQ